MGKVGRQSQRNWVPTRPFIFRFPALGHPAASSSFVLLLYAPHTPPPWIAISSALTTSSQWIFMVASCLGSQPGKAIF